MFNLPIAAGTCDLFGKSNDTFLNVLAIAVFIVRILQIVVPILLIVYGSIDIARAVIAGDEKKIQEAQKPFVKRIVAAVIVFLIPFLVGVVLNLVNGKEWKDCWNAAKEKGQWSNLFNNNPLDIK